MRHFGRRMETIKKLKILAFVEKVEGFHNQRKETIKNKNHDIRDETFCQVEQ